MKLTTILAVLVSQTFAYVIPDVPGSLNERDENPESKSNGDRLVQVIKEFEANSTEKYEFKFLKSVMGFFSKQLDGFDLQKYPNMTLLIPTDDAFKGFSLSILADSKAVISFVQCKLKVIQIMQ
jgi:hypothetical protein